MFSRIKTQRVSSNADIGDFYDRLAPSYSHQHGSPDLLLQYKLKIVRRYARLREDSVLLELGCGLGQHLMGLIRDQRRGFGVDISPGMINEANKRLRGFPFRDRVVFRQENAEELCSIPTETIDLAFCVGSFEHMLDKKAVLRQVLRALKPERSFLCLTHNGGSLWNRRIAPYLKMPTTHLSTDEYLDQEEISHLALECGYASLESGFWSFIPRGDVHFPFGAVLQTMDFLGRIFKWGLLREGLVFVARKG